MCGKNKKRIYMLTTLFVLILGMYFENIKIDSAFAYVSALKNFLMSEEQTVIDDGRQCTIKE